VASCPTQCLPPHREKYTHGSAIRREGTETGPEQVERVQEREPRMRLVFFLLSAATFVIACSAQGPTVHGWTQFVHVEGQPELVPAEWVATPEGKFAHSIKTPSPLPKHSGYQRGMTSEQYFDHLCKNEAGEFIYKTVENVEGFYFMRAPNRPTDDDLKDRYKLEAPEIERLFQLLRDTPTERAELFINPPWNLYKFVEEPLQRVKADASYVRTSGYRQSVSPMRNETLPQTSSKHGLVWRGIKRPGDREHAIAGSEWIVIDLQSNEVLAVMRNYGRTGGTRNVKEGIWWLNAIRCPQLRDLYPQGFESQPYGFVSKVIKPIR
jgi:hypothetical protein